MTDRLIALASGVHDGRPPVLSPEDMVYVAAEAGYNSVGLWVEPGQNWQADTTRKVRRALDDTGLTVLDVEVIWLQPGANPDPDHQRIIEIGGDLGARNCLIVSSDPDLEATKRHYEILCRHAEKAGMRACLEYLGITAIKTLDDALAVVEGVDHPAGGILVDPFHHERMGHEPARLAEIAPRWISYAQMCDVPERGAITDYDAYLVDALDGRLAPGEGALPLNEYLALLPDELPLSLEIRSLHYREHYPDPVERARVILDRTLAFLDTQ